MTTSSLEPSMLTAIEETLKESLASINAPPTDAMYAMMAHHLGWTGPAVSRGKRIRPRMTLLCCAAAGGDWRLALPAAAAVELVHNFSLIHDDIEDNSDTRRGRPTVWKEWGLAQALNTGDAMFTLASLAMMNLDATALPLKRVHACRIRLDQACLQLTCGQHLDIDFETRENVTTDEYLAMIHGKTGSLLAAACACGACLATDSETSIDAYHRFGLHLGLAFQIQDDILGLWGDPAQTGKPAGDDLLQRKKTFPLLFALHASEPFREAWSRPEYPLDSLMDLLMDLPAQEAAEEAAQQHTAHALAALREAAPLGHAGDELKQLAQKLLRRLS